MVLTQFLPLVKFLETKLIVFSNANNDSFTIVKSQTGEYLVIDDADKHHTTFANIGIIESITLINLDTDKETELYNNDY